MTKDLITALAVAIQTHGAAALHNAIDDLDAVLDKTERDLETSSETTPAPELDPCDFKVDGHRVCKDPYYDRYRCGPVRLTTTAGDLYYSFLTKSWAASPGNPRKLALASLRSAVGACDAKVTGPVERLWDT